MTLSALAMVAAHAVVHVPVPSTSGQAVLTLPLLVPLLIACAQATEPLMRQDAGPEELGRWLGLLSLYDVVFVLLSVAVFDFLLED